MQIRTNKGDFPLFGKNGIALNNTVPTKEILDEVGLRQLMVLPDSKIHLVSDVVTLRTELSILKSVLKKVWSIFTDPNSPLSKAAKSVARYERYFKPDMQIQNIHPNMTVLGHSNRVHMRSWDLLAGQNWRRFNALSIYHHSINVELITDLILRNPKIFYDIEDFNDRIKVVMQIAAISHDVGEVVSTIGDITYEEKTFVHDELELKSVLKNLHYFSNLNDIERFVFKCIYHYLVYLGNNPLAFLHKLFERVEYSITATAVFKEKDEGIFWEWLVGNVFHHQGRHLFYAVKQFSSFNDFIFQLLPDIRVITDFLEQNKKEARDITDADIAIWRDIIWLLS